MKHIEHYKLFLERSQSSLDSPYWEISRHEYINSIQPTNDEFIINNWVPFTKDEMQKISELIPVDSIVIGRILSSKCVINKLVDEWYYVITHCQDIHSSDSVSYYKCDQFDGLIKLIKNVIL